MHKALIPIMFGLLFGCSSTPPRPSGAVMAIDVSKAVSIPEKSARIYIQRGNIGADFNDFAPYCEIEVNTVSDGSHQLAAGTLNVYRSYRLRTQEPLLGAPLPPTACPDPVYFERHFFLQSNAQPDIRKMVCRERFSGCGGRYLSDAGIARTLGKNFKLRKKN